MELTFYFSYNICSLLTEREKNQYRVTQRKNKLFEQ